jgi:hypothetical protein
MLDICREGVGFDMTTLLTMTSSRGEHHDYGKKNISALETRSRIASWNRSFVAALLSADSKTVHNPNACLIGVIARLR